MKNSSRRLLLALVLLVLSVAGYGIWYARVSEKSSNVANLQSQIDEKQQAALRVSSARAALAEIANNEAIVNGYFVPEAGVVDFINSLEGLGKKLGARVSVLSVAAGDASAPRSLVMELTATGSFDAVTRTVGAIEFSPYDLSLSALSLRQSVTGGWGADLTLLVGSSPSSPSSTSRKNVTRPPSTTPATKAPPGPQPL